jgi:thiol-disulfide isomerase/thioredoxin
VVALFALVAGVLVYQKQVPVEEPMPIVVAEPASAQMPTEPVYPSFKLPDIDGVERDFSEWAGKTRLLNFWATWCAPCRREIPLLKSFQEEQSANSFQIIGIAVDFPEEVAAYAEEAQFNYPVLVGQEDAMAIAETSGVEFIGMPFTMIVAADGELLNAHIGEILRADLDHIVAIITRLEEGELDKEGARKALSTL